MPMGAERRPVAFLLILLLAGEQVYQVNALRDDINSELRLDNDDDNVPKSDEDCKMNGALWNSDSYCDPPKYCEYKLVLWSLSRHKSCRLMPAYWSDLRTAVAFGARSSDALERSEAFGKSGGIVAFYKLRGDVAELAEVQNAIAANLPPEKEIAKEMKKKYADSSISEYHTFLQKTAEEEGFGELKAFDINAFDDTAKQEAPVDRFLKNIKAGSERTSALKEVLGKIDLTKLRELSAEKSHSKEKLKDCFVGYEMEQIKEAIQKGSEKEAEVRSKCGEDPDCLADAEEAEMRQLEEKTALPEGEDIEKLERTLLQMVGVEHNNTAAQGDAEHRMHSLLQLYDDHVEKLANAEGEDAEHAYWILSGIIAGLVAFIVMMSLTAMMPIAVWGLIQFSLLVVVYSLAFAGAFKLKAKWAEERRSGKEKESGEK